MSSNDSFDWIITQHERKKERFFRSNIRRISQKAYNTIVIKNILFFAC